MDPAAVLERVAGVDLAGADRAAVVGVLGDVARLRGWLDAREVACLERLGALVEVTFPETTLAQATRQAASAAGRVCRHAVTLAVFARFAKALEAGEVTGGHVDALTSGLADVPAARRGSFVAEQDRLLDAACRQGVDEFTKGVRDTVRRVLAGEDTKARLRRQQQAARLRWWTCKTTGMVKLAGALDPETGARVVSRLEADLAQRFGDRTHLPDTCPDDPMDREAHLRAMSLAAVVLEPGGGSTPETLMVIDEQTYRSGFHGGSIVDVGLDVDLPHEARQRMVLCSKVVPVVIRDGVAVRVLDGGLLNLGRSSRLANPSQRRALRAMYPTCAVPGCGVRFTHCRIHHIVWWDHGGRTDLCHLVPLCDRHHHAVHDKGWLIALDPTTRRLDITLPDGTVMSTGPPYARCA